MNSFDAFSSYIERRYANDILLYTSNIQIKRLNEWIMGPKERGINLHSLYAKAKKSVKKALRQLPPIDTLISAASLMVTIIIAVVTINIQLQLHQEDSKRLLTGDVLVFSMYEQEEGAPVEGGDWANVRVTIANDGAVALFVSEVAAEREDGGVVPLVATNDPKSEASQGVDAYYVGRKIDPGQGLVFDMRFVDEEKHRKLGDGSLTFYVQTVSGEKFVLEPQLIQAGSDSKTTTFSISDDWHRDENGNIVRD